mmetsp:Transcript_26375/g.86539  ORF Transcript_26375/g.86539 Transcript_26375/m.86539 type:complete len:342 (-) Transcript_26375:2649-3674(-)
MLAAAGECSPPFLVASLPTASPDLSVRIAGTSVRRSRSDAMRKCCGTAVPPTDLSNAVNRLAGMYGTSAYACASRTATHGPRSFCPSAGATTYPRSSCHHWSSVELMDGSAGACITSTSPGDESALVAGAECCAPFALGAKKRSSFVALPPLVLAAADGAVASAASGAAAGVPEASAAAAAAVSTAGVSATAAVLTFHRPCANSATSRTLRLMDALVSEGCSSEKALVIFGSPSFGEELIKAMSSGMSASGKTDEGRPAASLPPAPPASSRPPMLAMVLPGLASSGSHAATRTSGAKISARKASRMFCPSSRCCARFCGEASSPPPPPPPSSESARGMAPM